MERGKGGGGETTAFKIKVLRDQPQAMLAGEKQQQLAPPKNMDCLLIIEMQFQHAIKKYIFFKKKTHVLNLTATESQCTIVYSKNGGVGGLNCFSSMLNILTPIAYLLFPLKYDNSSSFIPSS